MTRYQKCKEQGLCYQCYKPSDNGTAYCSSCRQRRNAQSRKSAQYKKEVGRCIKCGRKLNQLTVWKTKCNICRMLQLAYARKRYARMRAEQNASKVDRQEAK